MLIVLFPTQVKTIFLDALVIKLNISALLQGSRSFSELDPSSCVLGCSSIRRNIRTCNSVIFTCLYINFGYVDALQRQISIYRVLTFPTGAGFIFKFWGIIPVWIGATIGKYLNVIRWLLTPLFSARLDHRIFIGPHNFAQLGWKVSRKISKIQSSRRCDRWKRLDYCVAGPFESGHSVQFTQLRLSSNFGMITTEAYRSLARTKTSLTRLNFGNIS